MHNFGDDLIGAVLVRSLQSQFNMSAVVPGMSADNCKWLNIEHEDSAARAVIRAGSVLIGGGGILGNSGLNPTNRYLKRSLKAALSRLAGRRVAITGVGAGPLAFRSSRVLCRLICGLAQKVGVRDKESAGFLTEAIGVRSEKITVGADVALLWPEMFSCEVAASNAIGVQFDADHYDSAQSNLEYPAIREVLTSYCRDYSNRIVFVSNSNTPTAISWRVGTATASLEYSSLPDFLSRLAGLRAIVTSHLHLAIAAFAARVPCFSVFVREKTLRFYHQIGRPDRALDIRTTTATEVAEMLHRVADSQWTESDERMRLELCGRAQRLVELCSVLAN